jgi:membrane protease YdiL (CAAX protease family)
MARMIFYALNSLVLAAVVSSLLFWIHRLVKHHRLPESVNELVALTPREKPRWTLGEFFLMFGLSIISIVALQSAAASLGWLERPEVVIDAVVPGDETSPAEMGPKPAETAPSMMPMLIINTLAGLISLGLTLLWLKFVAGCSRAHLGLTMKANDIALGFKSAWWFIPPVLIISVLASLLIPYEHPVLETLANTAVPGTWVMLFISTAIIVPFVEEFMFRVVLQGGLQRFADPQTSSMNESSLDIAEGEPTDVSDGTDSASQTWLADAYQPPVENSTRVDSHDIDTTQAWRPQSFWPIVVTSILFAMMHLGQGAAFIPLFFLSLGLGYLYRQTGRITAPVIVHMILNGVTMVAEFSRIAAGIEQGGF